MKLCTVLFVLLALCTESSRAQESFSPEYKRALQEGAMAKVSLHVKDDSGLPVPNADATVYYDMINKKGTVVCGVTDDKGVFSAEGLCADYAAITVTKQGYYDSRFRYSDIRSRDPERLKDGRWLPWNPTIPVVLKPVRDPVHMALSFNEIRIPNFDEPLGFDLEKHDWVSPEGKGRVADMVVRFEPTGDDVPFRKLSVEFPGAMNGAYVRKKDGYSILKSDYHAMTNGVYETRLANEDGMRGPAHILLGADDYLVFRIRSKVDHNGKVVSAMYGKIYGPFDYFVNSRNKMRLISFLNPTDNDTNLEFDGNGFGDGSPFGR